MVYRLLGWGVWWVEPSIRYRIQIVSCASEKIMELVHRLTNIPRFSEVGGIWCPEQL